MDKEKLKKCRYYHGEASCPYPDRSSIFFWMCESEWCNHAGDYSKEIKDLKDAHFDDFAIDEYGGEHAPVSLLSLIMPRQEKAGSCCVSCVFISVWIRLALMPLLKPSPPISLPIKGKLKN